MARPSSWKSSRRPVADNLDLSKVFGGGKGAAADEGPLSDGDGADELLEDDELDAPPADFAVHAAEAFPELAGDDARIDALYRTIKACHPVV